MLKKLLFGTIALAAIFTINLPSKAADVYETIQVTGYTYPNVNYFPRSLHVNQGDTLHLTVKNTERGDVRIYMPAFNLAQDISKGNVATFDLCISSPIDDNMWFTISSIDAKQIPGHMITSNYQVPNANMASRTIDTSALNDIINYNKNFCYDQKAEPKYVGGASKVRVRGFW